MALPRRRVIPVKRASNRPAAKTDSKKKLARRRVVPVKRTAKQEADYRAMQKKPTRRRAVPVSKNKKPKRGMRYDDLTKLKTDAPRPPKIEKPKAEVSYAPKLPPGVTAPKPGDPNYRDRGARGGSKTLPFTRPGSSPIKIGSPVGGRQAMTEQALQDLMKYKRSMEEQFANLGSESSRKITADRMNQIQRDIMELTSQMQNRPTLPDIGNLFRPAPSPRPRPDIQAPVFRPPTNISRPFMTRRALRNFAPFI